ncbi:hypothetical protein AKJ48_04140 [candidate division MSBL1 archaeon SCGC-AAA261O19]|uniref:HTH cro/C1-type domain-containing protein n=1 Tax=candidate division MSBL1 archaeon SCGC-AAA261O19 TaxID=1698277 RepID=A0A133V9S6_9EURY|nr:hypothetical protein AKJ48_04140 [candidate division MSBL1 archaeon SCGC-AAA261O19]
MSKVDDELVEYVSRPTRSILSRKLVNYFRSMRSLARKLGGSEKTVRNWVKTDGSHPSNELTRKIIRASLKENPGLTLTILNNDLLKHQATIKRLFEQLSEDGDE